MFGNTLESKCLLILFLPLAGSVLAGVLGKRLGKTFVNIVTILCMSISAILATTILVDYAYGVLGPADFLFYNWFASAVGNISIGFMVDKLTAVMMFVVTSISLLVHIYSIEYMKEDKSYYRFFSYISFFTFAMLALVMADNFLQLFFGWEAVGLASYLLIGFWFNKDSAIAANFKAFIVNRVGDFAFILAIACIFYYFRSLHYIDVFDNVRKINDFRYIIYEGWAVSPSSLICILLFIGAMAKSAQIPLHVWLPDSMEGPTPISALIHAATMVTAGIFMVARVSPVFELSEAALSFMLIMGSSTCLFMGILALVQNDIKRIIAYSTLSQLGYMVIGLGLSAYAGAIFHLVTHAFFKALLFLGAGSVIVALHHEQDINRMGGLYKRMPITYITMLLASMSLVGFPFFSGFYSKDLIIQLCERSNIYGSSFAMFAANLSVLFTAIYSFRLIIKVFHGSEKSKYKAKEPGVSILLPLVLLAIPSVILGYLMLPVVFDNFFEHSIYVLPEHDLITEFKEDVSGSVDMGLHGFTVLPFKLLIIGGLISWLFYIKYTNAPKYLAAGLAPLYKLLINNYGFDLINEKIIAPMFRAFSRFCAFVIDKRAIDGFFVNGLAQITSCFAKLSKRLQSEYLYNNVLIMVIGIVFLSVWLIYYLQV